MNCKEFRLQVGSATRPEALTGSAGISEHIRRCRNCRSFFEVQQQVGAHLRAVRDSFPRDWAKLDASVLANYRVYRAGRTASGGSVPLPSRIAPHAWTWGVAVAAGILLAVIVALNGKGRFQGTALRRVPEVAAVPQRRSPEATAAGLATKAKPQARRSRLTESTLNTVAHQPRRKRAAVSVAANNKLPEGFRSLMYCDQLSCGEAMEVIRVQLPTSSAGLTSGSAEANGIVFADVLVGPDGIARGIRVIE